MSAPVTITVRKDVAEAAGVPEVIEFGASIGSGKGYPVLTLGGGTMGSLDKTNKVRGSLWLKESRHIAGGGVGGSGNRFD